MTVGLEERYEDDAEDFLATHLYWVNGAAKKQQELPPGACYWQQGSLIKGIPTGPSEPDCKFQVSTGFVKIIRVTCSQNQLFLPQCYVGTDRKFYAVNGPERLVMTIFSLMLVSSSFPALRYTAGISALEPC